MESAFTVLMFVIIIATALAVGFLLGLKFDNWLRDTWATEMAKRLDARNAEVATLIEDRDTYKALLADVRKELKNQREWPEIIG